MSNLIQSRSPVAGINPGDVLTCYCGPFAVFRNASGPGVTHYVINPDCGLVVYGHGGVVELLETIATINRKNAEI